MKLTNSVLAALASLVIVGTTSCSEQAKAEPGRQTTCPVMNGNPIDPNHYVDVQGKRIYVCCAGCIAPIKADPEKYITQMEADGVVLEDAPGSEDVEDHSGHDH